MKFYSAFFSVLFIGVLFFSCKNHDPIEPLAAPFSVFLTNDFSPIDGRFAAFLSDEDGKMLAFRWLAGHDTARIDLAGTVESQVFDLTVVKILDLDGTGTGVKDTFVTLTTYTRVHSGQKIWLRPTEYRTATDLAIKFVGITSLDSIIVPDGYPFARPSTLNDFTGLYHVLHTGKIWFRIRVNGEPDWRFMYFENIAGADLNATIDVNLLPHTTAPQVVGLPFLGHWKYEIQAIQDSNSLKITSLGDLLRAPGGAIPNLDALGVFQPTPPQNVQGFRLAVSGFLDDAGGWGFGYDRFLGALPDKLDAPTFDLGASTVSNSRAVAAICLGKFDLLSFTRGRSASPHFSWTAQVVPVENAAVSYRLPDVPAELGALFPKLKAYDFDASVRSRAEKFDKTVSFDQIQAMQMENVDIFWRARLGMTARER